MGRIDFFEIAPGEIEVLAVVGAVFFIHRLGAALAALMCHNDVEVNAIATATQIRVAFLARIAPSGRVGERPIFPALETMPRHRLRVIA